MRILDRQRYWNFLKAYVICFAALVGLYVVIHAFSNVDEFSEVADGTLDMLRRMGLYYFMHMSEFYDRLCGVIAMMAAIFTVTWMQKNNELLAMLAAGIGTKRVIRPVLVSAVLVSVVAVLNQELILAGLGDELLKPPDDENTRTVLVASRTDLNNILLLGRTGYRETQTVVPFQATIPISLARKLFVIDSPQARYIPADDPSCPLRGGWLFYDAKLPPSAVIDDKLAELIIALGAAELKDYPPPMALTDDEKDSSPRDKPRVAPPAKSALFLRTNVSFTTLTRNRQWYQFAPTMDLLRALRDPTYSKSEQLEFAVFLHNRLMRPFLGLALMAVSLPLVLGGEGRNTFVNLGMSLGLSAIFYAAIFMAQYLAMNQEISAELAAWAPLIAFGTLAVARWDKIRT